MPKTDIENEDDFLKDSGRNDWTRKEAKEARAWIVEILDNRAFDDLAQIPVHYYITIPGAKLNGLKNRLTNILAKIDAEISRRAR